MTPARRAVPGLVCVTMLAASALLAGCSGESSGATTTSPFTDCTALTSAPTPAPDSSGAASAAGGPLPEVRLPCFTGGQIVDIGQIRGPALVNLWASWCAPCREELPAFQRLAGQAAGRLHVVGVVSSDDRDAAESLARDLGVTFPALFDRQATLLGQLGRSGLPLTLFVDAAGQISHIYQSVPLDDMALARLTDRYLKVAVP